MITKVSPFLRKKGPFLLSCLAAVGTVATSVLAVKAAPKANQLRKNAEGEKSEKLSKMETVLAVAPAYIPALATGASTILCIFGANALNDKKQASLLGAYTLVKRMFNEYREKAVELYGEAADHDICMEIAKDKAPAEKEDEKQWSEEVVTFYESHYHELFERSWMDVLKAEYELNRALATTGDATLGDFYYLLGLPDPEEKLKEIGWSVGASEAFYNYPWIEFRHSTLALPDGMEVISIDMPYPPTEDFMNY